MSFLAPAAPAPPPVPAAPPPAPSFGMQPVGQKPTPKLQQSTFIGASAFPGVGQTQTATLMGAASGGKTLLGT